MMRTTARAALVVAAMTSALAVAGCSEGSHHASAPSTPAIAEATVRTATCHTWRAASPAEKQRLVIGMREFFGGQVDRPDMRGQVLPNARALHLFDGYCNQLYAGAFSLYRIYGNAAAFSAARK